MLIKLENSKFGCYFKTVCFNSMMYADDLVLLSISLTHMKMMVDLCVKEFLDLGMEINIKKSGCVRIGARHDAETDTLVINNMNWNGKTI